MKQVRVLHVINNLNDLGGAELALLRLVGGGDGARFEHRVVALLRAERLGAEFEAAGVAVSALDIRRGAAAAARRIATLLRAPAPDVIVGWLYYGNIAASLLGAVRRVPVLWNVRHSTHDLQRSGRSTRVSLALCGGLASLPRAIVYNSIDVARQHAARRMGNGWIEVIQNGIDCKLFHPDEVARARWRAAWGAQRDTLVIGRFGRYHALKGYAELVDAFAALPNRDRQLLVLGGRGVDQDNVELQRLIAAAGIASQVRLLGEIRGLHSVLPALDLFVSTSHGESFPNVVAEAMACGVPCVATAVGASAHIVGDAGWTVSPAAMKHLPAVIAHALRCVEQNPLIRRRAVTRIAEGFSMAAMVERYEAMFATLAVPS